MSNTQFWRRVTLTLSITLITLIIMGEMILESPTAWGIVLGLIWAYLMGCLDALMIMKWAESRQRPAKSSAPTPLSADISRYNVPPYIQLIGIELDTVRHKYKNPAIYVKSGAYDFILQQRLYSRYSDHNRLYLYGCVIVALPAELEYLFSGASFFIDEEGKFPKVQ